MAVTAKWFGNGAKNIANGTVTWKAAGGSAIKTALMTGYTPDQDTQEFWDDVSANEVPATGNYTAGGTAVTLSDPTYDSATNETRLDATDATWASSTISATHAIVYHDSGTPSTSPLLGYVDFGQTESSSNGTFTVQWAATGILKFTAL